MVVVVKDDGQFHSKEQQWYFRMVTTLTFHIFIRPYPHIHIFNYAALGDDVVIIPTGRQPPRVGTFYASLAHLTDFNFIILQFLGSIIITLLYGNPLHITYDVRLA